MYTKHTNQNQIEEYLNIDYRTQIILLRNLVSPSNIALSPDDRRPDIFIIRFYKISQFKIKQKINNYSKENKC